MQERVYWSKFATKRCKNIEKLKEAIRVCDMMRSKLQKDELAPTADARVQKYFLTGFTSELMELLKNKILQILISFRRQVIPECAENISNTEVWVKLMKIKCINRDVSRYASRSYMTIMVPNLVKDLSDKLSNMEDYSKISCSGQFWVSRWEKTVPC